MSSIVYLRNSKTNTIYAYLNERVWDAEKGKNVYKRKCIGHVDPETGEIVPNRKNKVRETPTVKSRYLCAVFDKVSEESHLMETLKLSFPDEWKKILTIAYFLASTQQELSFCKQWSEQHKTPYNQPMNVATINDLLTSINSNGISLFFTLWKLRLQPINTFASTMTFGGQMVDLSKYGDDLDFSTDDFNNSMRMVIYYSTKNNIPICYQLSDTATNRKIEDYDVSPNSFSRLSAFMDETKGDTVDPSLIPYADSNITVRLRPDNEFVRDLVLRCEPHIAQPANYKMIMGTPLFVESYMQYINGKRYFMHIYFDPNKAVSNLSAFISIINMCKYELEMDMPSERHQDLYDRFLIVKDDDRGNRVVELNGEAIMNHNKLMGFDVLISNYTGNSSTAIIPFIQKSFATRIFNSIRNEYDSTMLNLFTETNYLSRIFLQFISLILRIEVLNVMNSKKLNKIMSFTEMVLELSNIRTVNLPGVKKGHTTFVSDTQHRILRAFDITFNEET